MADFSTLELTTPSKWYIPHDISLSNENMNILRAIDREYNIARDAKLGTSDIPMPACGYLPSAYDLLKRHGVRFRNAIETGRTLASIEANIVALTEIYRVKEQQQKEADAKIKAELDPFWKSVA